MGPLQGFTIIEMAGIGPGPMCAMLMAQLGASVIRIDRPPSAAEDFPLAIENDFVARGRRSIALNLKDPQAVGILLDLVARADALIEGFRPGVMERLGLGPDTCFARNKRLVYGRMTGFGQEGPLAQAAGHDINYISLTGALHAIGRAGAPPTPPLNLVGDFGGGALYLVVGVLAALLRAERTGFGDVVDAAMVDGAASLMTLFYSLKANGRWTDERGSNVLDGGAPWYDTYETKDGRYMAIGAVEPKFFAELARLIGLDEADVRSQYDTRHWPMLRAKMTGIFASRTRTEWQELLEGTDACATAVLSLSEAAMHPHMQSRGTFRADANSPCPAPAPRFRNAGNAELRRTVGPGANTASVLSELGYSATQIEDLARNGVIVCHNGPSPIAA